jgi:hypothetical protein
VVSAMLMSISDYWLEALWHLNKSCGNTRRPIVMLDHYPITHSAILR